MTGVNKAIIMGNLGSDAELRYSQGSQAVANFRVATSKKWTSKDGTAREETQWHSVVWWGKGAEACSPYLKKGKPVYVEGEIQYRKFTGKDGQERHITEIRANEVKLLGGGEQSKQDYAHEDGDLSL